MREFWGGIGHGVVIVVVGSVLPCGTAVWALWLGLWVLWIVVLRAVVNGAKSSTRIKISVVKVWTFFSRCCWVLIGEGIWD